MRRRVACRRCGGPLPAGSRSDRDYCGVRCRVAAFRELRRPGPRAVAPIRDSAGWWCVCDRPTPVATVDGGQAVLDGRWALEAGTWIRNIWSPSAVRRVPLPARVRCPACRTDLAVTA